MRSCGHFDPAIRAVQNGLGQPEVKKTDLTVFLWAFVVIETTKAQLNYLIN